MSEFAFLPTKADENTMAEYVSRIVDVFRSATVDQLVDGVEWYREANALAAQFVGGATAGAGIIAAFSANTGWSRNQMLAAHLFATGEVKAHIGADKVQRIVDGEDPANVLPMDKKTGYFFACIADPDHPTAVVVDRHAHDIVAGRKFGDNDRGLQNVNRYNTIAEAYRLAAEQIGDITPSELQAVTWCAWIAR